MIEFSSTNELFKCGLSFCDFFDEVLFQFFIHKDGSMFYDPVSNFLCSKEGHKVIIMKLEKKELLFKE
ncbi:hypothetical protein A5844_000647 [Enterococcus sp. 10A9_DIV0425]|uniref:Uncharacterized protein n=1 Tax=Candidatus Enterococcus wittei TaxID=1987383 RepID=A0A2C9XSM7_9ENTE|nr:hypothetical protein [Enterococcus sp. 10A9_DIV0425]OTP12414.1 hypothetical protein A5844_000647 [Enterococcus sp. 10A9_DIV0425]THE07492.1 hypothetical protein E1H99_12370 [Enterococcus hirae]